MPRILSGDLAEALERPNTAVRPHITISAPDVEQVFRRPDQWFSADVSVSITPPASLIASATGALTLSSSAHSVASSSGIGSGGRDLNGEGLDLRLRALSFAVASDFKGVVLREFKATIHRTPWLGFFFPATFSLQIYRATGTAYVLSQPVAGSSTPKTSNWIDWTFTPLLQQEALLPAQQITWDGSQNGVATFDLTNFRLTLEHKNMPSSSPTNPGELQQYFFRINTTVPMPTDGLYTWLWGPSVTTVAHVGTFQQVDWVRDNVSAQWQQNKTAKTPAFELDVEVYTPSGQEIVAFDLGRVPSLGTAGEVIFDRSVPPGSSCIAEVSFGDETGPWQRVGDGDVVSVAQQQYFGRLTLTSTTPFYRAPSVTAFGIRFRTPIDVSNDATLQTLPQEIGVPFCEASIGSETLNVIRSGKRDYEDFATLAALSGPATSLEVDVYLGAPSVARDGWFHLERCLFSGRAPSAVQEAFTLYSYGAGLKKKIPQRIESINTVHTVQTGTTTTAVQVSPQLLSFDVDLYDGAGYYLRVQKSAVPKLSGYIATIAGNTLGFQLDFTAGAFPTPLLPGDVIEVHSARYLQPTLSWEDADPADVWLELLTEWLAISPERIGLGGGNTSNRGGYPPTVAQRAPDDTATQAKLRVTMQLTEQETADELIDQLSFIMGGATIVIGGQICFVQIYPSRGPDGSIVIPLGNAAAILDPRDYTALDTPVGLEQRITVMSCDYGVNKTAANPDATPANTTYFVDADAEAALAPQDLEGLGYTEIDDKINRWMYNAADGGLYLASMLCQQVVLACSTGMRVWSWTAVEQYPELCVGDVVTIVTDQYTDYDPATGMRFAGWFAYNLVLISCTDAGTRFRGYLLGLAPNAVKLQGGPGTLTGSSEAIPVPVVTLTETRTDQGATGAGSIFLRASWDTIQNPFFDHMEYEVSQNSPNDPLGIFTQNARIRGTRTGPDIIAAAFAMNYAITPITVSTGGTQNVGTPILLTTSSQIGSVGIVSVVPGASSVVYNLSYPPGTVAYYGFYKQFATDPGLLNLEKVSGAIVIPQFWQTDTPSPVLVLPVDATNPWVALTLFPFTAIGRSLAYLDRQERNASASLPSTPSTPTLQSNPVAGPVVVRTTYSTGAVAGDTMRLYRDGSFLLSRVLTSGDITTAHYDFSDSTAHSSTTYSYTSSMIATATGLESAASSALSVTTPSSTLGTPASFTATRDPSDYSTANLAWSVSGYPMGVKFTVERSVTSITTGYSVIATGVSGSSYPASITPAQTWIRIKAVLSPYTDSAYSAATIGAYHGPL